MKHKAAAAKAYQAHHHVCILHVPSRFRCSVLVRMEITLWAHSDEGKNKEAMLHSPMRGFEVLVDDAFDFQAVDVE